MSFPSQRSLAPAQNQSRKDRRLTQPPHKLALLNRPPICKRTIPLQPPPARIIRIIKVKPTIPRPCIDPDRYPAGVIGIAAHVEAVGELVAEVELLLRGVEEGGADVVGVLAELGGGGLGHEDGIVETGARVVGLQVEGVVEVRGGEGAGFEVVGWRGGEGGEGEGEKGKEEGEGEGVDVHGWLLFVGEEGKWVGQGWRKGLEVQGIENKVR